MSHWNGFSLVPGLFRKWTSGSPILWPGGSFCHRSLLPPLLLSVRRRMGRACLPCCTPLLLSAPAWGIHPACLPPSFSVWPLFHPRVGMPQVSFSHSWKLGAPQLGLFLPCRLWACVERDAGVWVIWCGWRFIILRAVWEGGLWRP